MPWIRTPAGLLNLDVVESLVIVQSDGVHNLRAVAPQGAKWWAICEGSAAECAAAMERIVRDLKPIGG